MPKCDSINSRLSQLPVSGSGERCTAPEPGQVRVTPAHFISLKSCTKLSAPPLVVLAKRDWLMGAGPESQKFFDLLLISVGFDPEIMPALYFELTVSFECDLENCVTIFVRP